MNFISKFILIGFVSIVISGCGVNLANMSVASLDGIKNLSVNKLNQYVEGESCIHHLLGIPLGTMENRINFAMANAMENALTQYGIHAEGLSNITIRTSYWTAIVYGQTCVIVKGVPIISKQTRQSR